MKIKILFILLSVFYLIGCNPSRQINKQNCNGEHGCMIVNKTDHSGNSSIIKGVVKDKKTGETLPFTNIVLLKQGKVIVGTYSDLEGHFELKNIANDKYILKMTFVGYDNIEKFLEVNRPYIFNVEVNLSHNVILLDNTVN